MGADFTARPKSKRVVAELENMARKVPIDFDADDFAVDGTVHFHYGYWGGDHARRCEKFLDEIERDGLVEILSRSY